MAPCSILAAKLQYNVVRIVPTDAMLTPVHQDGCPPSIYSQEKRTSTPQTNRAGTVPRQKHWHVVTLLSVVLSYARRHLFYLHELTYCGDPVVPSLLKDRAYARTKWEVILVVQPANPPARQPGHNREGSTPPHNRAPGFISTCANIHFWAFQKVA